VAVVPPRRSATALVFVKKPILGDGLVAFDASRGGKGPGGVPSTGVVVLEDEELITDDPGSLSPEVQLWSQRQQGRGSARVTVQMWDGLLDFELNLVGLAAILLVLAALLVVPPPEHNYHDRNSGLAEICLRF
jgi:hypothetical protein